MEEKILEMQAQIKSLHDEIALERQRADAYTMGKEIGTVINAMLEGLTDAGLGDATAAEVLFEIIKAGVK